MMARHYAGTHALTRACKRTHTNGAMQHSRPGASVRTEADALTRIKAEANSAAAYACDIAADADANAQDKARKTYLKGEDRAWMLSRTLTG